MSRTKRYSWTQPICPWCYQARHPGREPSTLVEGRVVETCVDCGEKTGSGIYVRVDPATAKHPTNER